MRGLGTTRSPPAGATTRDEQWTVCGDMIRGGSKGPREVDPDRETAGAVF